jgi:hypothetical protein
MRNYFLKVAFLPLILTFILLHAYPLTVVSEEKEKDIFDQINDVGFHFFLDTSTIIVIDGINKDYDIDQAEIDFEREFFDFLTVRVDFDYIPDRLPEEFRFEQAYIMMNFKDFGNGLQVKLGKSNFFMGLEGIDAPELYQYSYATLSFYPQNYLGATITYQLTDWINISFAGYTGGDQDFDDNNDSLSFGGRLGYLPVEGVEFYTGVAFGPEKSLNDDDNTFFINGEMRLSCWENIFLGAEIQFGQDEGIFYTDEKASWLGGLIVFNYMFNKIINATVRVDYFSDDQGAATGIKQNIFNLTGAVLINPVHPIWLLGEIRYSKSDQLIFYNETDGLSDNQLTIALELLFSF